MSKAERELAREATLRGRFWRAGFPDPVCGLCGEGRIVRLAEAALARAAIDAAFIVTVRGVSVGSSHPAQGSVTE